MGMAWERPALHKIRPGMVSHNQGFLLPLAAAEPAAGAVGDPPSSAAAIGHMMDNLLDDMEVLHPGVREEVQQTICAPQEGWPAQGPANPKRNKK